MLVPRLYSLMYLNFEQFECVDSSSYCRLISSYSFTKGFWLPDTVPLCKKDQMKAMSRVQDQTKKVSLVPSMSRQNLIVGGPQSYTCTFSKGSNKRLTCLFSNESNESNTCSVPLSFFHPHRCVFCELPRLAPS